jgi:hypothetical protein
MKRAEKGPIRMIEEDGRVPVLDVGTVAKIRAGGVRFKVMRSRLPIRRIDGGSADDDDEAQQRGVFGVSGEAP